MVLTVLWNYDKLFHAQSPWKKKKEKRKTKRKEKKHVTKPGFFFPRCINIIKKSRSGHDSIVLHSLYTKQILALMHCACRVGSVMTMRWDYHQQRNLSPRARFSLYHLVVRMCLVEVSLVDCTGTSMYRNWLPDVSVCLFSICLILLCRHCPFRP